MKLITSLQSTYTLHLLSAFFLISMILGLYNDIATIQLSWYSTKLLHNIFESCNIIVSFTIFIITWLCALDKGTSKITMLSIGVMGAAILDSAHILTYPVLPTMTTEIFLIYGLCAHLFWSFSFLAATFLPNSTTNLDLTNKTILYSSILMLIGLITNIALNGQIWLNISLDYAYFFKLTYLNWLSLLINLLTLYQLTSNYDDTSFVISLNKALLYSILANFSFAFHDTPMIDLVGHICKIIANAYILNFLIKTIIHLPYENMTKSCKHFNVLADTNFQLYQESEKQRNLVEDTLAKVGTMITSQLNLKDTLDSISDMVADLTKARQVTIALLHKDPETLKVAAIYGISSPPDVLPLKNSLSSQVMQAKTALFINDLSLYPELYRPQMVFSTIRSIICAPLINDHELIGIIEAYSNQKGAFCENDALLLKAVGHHAGAAIASAMLYEETKLRLEEENHLLEVAQLSASSIDVNTIIEQCTNSICLAFKSDTSIGLLVEQKSRNLSLKCSSGLSAPLVSEIDLKEHHNLSSILSSLKPVQVSGEIFNKIIYGDITSSTVKNTLFIPLTISERLLGVIILGWTQYYPKNYINRTAYAELLGQQVALGLEKAYLYTQIKAMALSDGLTGLANRRNFDMYLSSEIRRANSLKRPLSLIMLDLDKFKTFNDTYGHLIGDSLLAKIGEILRHEVRNIDFPARYGGEEFSIILPECSSTECYNIAEHLRMTIEKNEFADNFSTFTAKITASLGIVTYNTFNSSFIPDPSDLIIAADNSLYEAKKQGRNKVCVSEPL